MNLARQGTAQSEGNPSEYMRCVGAMTDISTCMFDRQAHDTRKGGALKIHVTPGKEDNTERDTEQSTAPPGVPPRLAQNTATSLHPLAQNNSKDVQSAAVQPSAGCRRRSLRVCFWEALHRSECLHLHRYPSARFIRSPTTKQSRWVKETLERSAFCLLPVCLPSGRPACLLQKDMLTSCRKLLTPSRPAVLRLHLHAQRRSRDHRSRHDVRRSAGVNQAFGTHEACA